MPTLLRALKCSIHAKVRRDIHSACTNIKHIALLNINKMYKILSTLSLLTGQHFTYLKWHLNLMTLPWIPMCSSTSGNIFSTLRTEQKKNNPGSHLVTFLFWHDLGPSLAVEKQSFNTRCHAFYLSSVLCLNSFNSVCVFNVTMQFIVHWYSNLAKVG